MPYKKVWVKPKKKMQSNNVQDFFGSAGGIATPFGMEHKAESRKISKRERTGSEFW